MKKLLLVLVGTIAIGLNPVKADAMVFLGSFDVSVVDFGSAVIFNTLEPQVGYQGSFGLDPATILFNGLGIGESDVGSMYESTAINDPNFAAFTAKLTNGTDDQLGALLGGGGGIKRESVWFSGIPPNGIDFQGFNIEKYKLMVNGASFDTPGSDPNQDGIWTTYSADITFSVFGSPQAVVPEPATMVLFGSGLAGAFLRRRRRT